MNKRCLFFLALTIGFMLALGDASSLFAQESGTDEFTLEEITVTAQKRTEDQQKVPVTMETILGEQIKELGWTDVDDIFSTISNTIINKTGDGLRVSLRGLANDANLSNQEMTTGAPTVAINIDGAYNSRNNAGQDLYDIERVEVLYGPQSTMYASNSPGGIVNIVTASPKTDKYEVSSTLEYGSYNLLHTEGSLNAPISDKMAIRTAFSTQVHDGYLSNGADDEDTKSARMKFLYKPYDKLSIIITGSYSLIGGNGFSSVTPFDKQSDVSDPWTSTESLESASGQHSKSLTTDIEWDLGMGSLSIIPSTSRTTQTSTRTSTDDEGDTYTTNGTMLNSQKGGEARMVSSSDFNLFKWIVGANYYKSTDSRATEYVDSDQYNSSTNTRKSYAFFGNITYPITDRFRATGGYRKSWDKMVSYQQELNKVDANHPTGYDMISTTIVEYSSPDYKIGVEYDLADNMMVYADRSTSYRMQGFGMPNSEGEFPPPEKLLSYTIGSKNRFFEQKLQLNVAAYYYKYKNKLANQMKASEFYEDDPRFIALGLYADDGTLGYDMNNDGTITHEENELHDSNSQAWGNFRSYGLDVQATWVITSQDKLDLSVSYLNAKWSNLVFNYEWSDFYPSEDFSGMVNTYSPEYTWNATYEHNYHLWNGAFLTPRFNIQYQSSYILTWTETDLPYSKQEPHHISNFYLIYSNSDSKWTLTGYVKNLENYALKTSYNDQGGGALMIGSPRTYGGVLSVRF